MVTVVIVSQLARLSVRARENGGEVVYKPTDVVSWRDRRQCLRAPQEPFEEVR